MCSWLKEKSRRIRGFPRFLLHYNPAAISAYIDYYKAAADLYLNVDKLDINLVSFTLLNKKPRKYHKLLARIAHLSAGFVRKWRELPRITKL